jgi:hypothetical protein
LTKLLLDNGFEIVQNSVDVTSRFGLEENRKGCDLDILDREDRQGVLVVGEAWAIEELRKLLIENLLDVVVRFRHSSWHDRPRVSLDFEFPGYSKSNLDEIRRSVTSTIPGHHFYKACGGSVSSAVDMAEKLITAGRSECDVERLFRRTISPDFPLEGSVVGIDHVKLDGSKFSLGEATVKNYSKSKNLVTLHRRLRGGGLYDGLNIEKKPGDYAVTEVKLGEWSSNTQYFSKKGDLRGTYVNFSTPVELYPHGIRYVDLEVDVCIWPRGGFRVLDMHLLKGAEIEGLISTRLSQFIQEKTEKLLREVRQKISDPP